MQVAKHCTTGVDLFTCIAPTAHKALNYVDFKYRPEKLRMMNTKKNHIQNTFKWKRSQQTDKRKRRKKKKC